jgi:hypothetical protein
MGFLQATNNAITNGLPTCIEHQHLWVDATYEQLAAVVLYSTAVESGIEQQGMLSQLSNCLGASMKGVEYLVQRCQYCS